MAKETIAKGKLQSGILWKVYKEEKFAVLNLSSKEVLKEGESKTYVIDESPWEKYIFDAVNGKNFENKDESAFDNENIKSEAISPKINSFTINYGENKSEKHVILLNGVTRIDKQMLYGYKTLKTLTLPKSLNWVSEYSFDNCNQFDGVYIDDLKAWCRTVFDYSNPLKCGRNLYLKGKKVEALEIPDGLKFVPNNAFYGCESITSLSFLSSVEWIGNCAFNGCINLKEVVIPEGVTQIGRYAFEGCSSLERLVLPSTLTNVAEHAFRACTNLKVVEFSGKPPYLRNDIFEDSKTLNRVITPDGVFKSYYDILSVDGVCKKDCDEKMRKLCARLRGNESVYSGFVQCSSPKLYIGEWAGKRAYVFQMQGDRVTSFEESARPYSETSYVDYWIYIPDDVSDEAAYDYALNNPTKWKRYINTETNYDI